MKANHQIKVVMDENSKILILGSFPSVKSREIDFYYGHKMNRFWPMMSYVFNIDVVSMSKDEKITFLKEKKIAMYDVVESCDIDLSKDSSIKNVEPANIKEIILKSKIEKILLNGKKAFSLFEKYNKEYLYMAKCMPSTSPANAQISKEKIIEIWKKELI